jgi:hypothetical protein
MASNKQNQIDDDSIVITQRQLFDAISATVGEAIKAKIYNDDLEYLSEEIDKVTIRSPIHWQLNILQRFVETPHKYILNEAYDFMWDMTSFKKLQTHATLDDALDDAWKVWLERAANNPLLHNAFRQFCDEPHGWFKEIFDTFAFATADEVLHKAVAEAKQSEHFILDDDKLSKLSYLLLESLDRCAASTKHEFTPRGVNFKALLNQFTEYYSIPAETAQTPGGLREAVGEKLAHDLAESIRFPNGKPSALMRILDACRQLLSLVCEAVKAAFVHVDADSCQRKKDFFSRYENTNETKKSTLKMR